MSKTENPVPDPAVSVFYAVTIDGHDIGSFMSCEGLAFEVEIEKREEGGNNDFVHQLPGRITYPNIKFTRPVNQDSQKLMDWFAKMRFPIKRTQAEIQAMRSDGKVVAKYSLAGVIPVKWSGPTLKADGPQVATETFEVAHHGFLPSS